MSWMRSVGAVVRRPWLWPTALRQAGRAAPPGWWRRAPFLPLPDREYLAWRLETQYGTNGAPEAGDVVAFLEWCRNGRRPTRR